MLIYDNKPENELNIYRCPACEKVLFKGFVLSYVMVCSHCNTLVSFSKNVQNPTINDMEN